MLQVPHREKANGSGKGTKAIILVGGPSRGTRFRPLSLDVPKPLFDVAGHPIIYHCLTAIAKVPCIQEVIMIGYYDEAVFKDFIKEAASEFPNLPIKYLREYQALGTAGGLYHFRDAILKGRPERIFVLNSDVCCSFPLNEMAKLFDDKDAEAIILGTRVPDQAATNFGCIVSDAHSRRVLHYVEKPEGHISTLINCGVYLFSVEAIFPSIKSAIKRRTERPRLLSYPSSDNLESSFTTAAADDDDDDTNKNEVIRLEQDILGDLADNKAFFVYETKDFWRQIKTAGSAVPANALYLQKAHQQGSPELAKPGPNIIAPVFIHPSAHVDPTAKLGPNVSIGPRVTIGAGARVKESIVLEDAEIRHDACVLYSIVGWNSRVGAWARVEGTPIPATSHSSSIIKNGVKVQSITILGKECGVGDEVRVQNCVCLPFKELKREAGFTPPSAGRKLAATTRSGRNPLAVKGRDREAAERLAERKVDEQAATWPAPLVLPGDDLALDPKYPAQTLRSWLREPVRNKPSRERDTIYVAASPEPVADLDFMNGWGTPTTTTTTTTREAGLPPSPPLPPSVEDCVDYIRAFYHGMRVKPLPFRLKYTLWEEPPPPPPKRKRPAGRAGPKKQPEAAAAVPAYVGLTARGTTTRIRTRAAPDGAFGGQVNLDDLLDALAVDEDEDEDEDGGSGGGGGAPAPAAGLVPSDAYAVALVVAQDMYEDEEDEFCCGRAYGASRVAVVSAARYHPALDGRVLHGGAGGKEDGAAHAAWPASHCREYVLRMAGGGEGIEEGEKRRRKGGRRMEKAAATGKRSADVSGYDDHHDDSSSGTPMRAAVDAAAAAVAGEGKGDEERTGRGALWFSRVARTLAHELGHCLGLDHCVFYACSMQGTAGLAEDARQPPYLCPVCLAKVSHAVACELGQLPPPPAAASEAEEVRARRYAEQRYAAVAAFCDRWARAPMFAAYGAWVRARLEGLRAEGGGGGGI